MAQASAHPLADRAFQFDLHAAGDVHCDRLLGGRPVVLDRLLSAKRKDDYPSIMALIGSSGEKGAMVPAPNYVKWCDRKLWTVHESICLALAMEPETPGLTDPYAVGGINPLIEALEQYTELAADAMALGMLRPFSDDDLSLPLLERRVSPDDFLRWAQTQHIAIPEELAPVLARDPTQRHDEKPSEADLVKRHYSRRITDRVPDAREQVLGAALAALKSFPGRCRDVPDIRRAIEDNAPLIWPDTHKPPLAADEIERVVGRWLYRLG